MTQLETREKRETYGWTTSGFTSPWPLEGAVGEAGEAEHDAVERESGGKHARVGGGAAGEAEGGFCFSTRCATSCQSATERGWNQRVPWLRGSGLLLGM